MSTAPISVFRPTCWLLVSSVLLLSSCGKEKAEKTTAPQPAESPQPTVTAKASAPTDAPPKAEIAAPAADQNPADKAAEAEPSRAAVPGKAPALRLVKAASDTDWALIKKNVPQYVGKQVVCSNLLAPVPLAVDAFSDQAAKKMVAVEMDNRRTALFCRTKVGGLDTIPVQVYFAEGSKGHLLHIDQDTVVNLEIRGQFNNQVVALFSGVVKAPRRAVFNAKAPDLMSAVLWPETFKGREIKCHSKMAVTPQAIAPFDRRAVDMVGGNVDPQKALTRCEDSSGGGVSLNVLFPKGQGKKVLEIGASTVFTATLHGYDRNNLVALFKKLESGAIKTAEGDLKNVLVDPAPHVGKQLSCTALVAPQPRELGAIDEQETTLLRVKLDDRKTALMCGQLSGGTVGLSLYFKQGAKRNILRMNANSKINFTFWGVVHNRLVGVFDAIKSGAMETKDPKDLRAVALSAEKFAGKLVVCENNLKPFVSGLSYMGDAKETLLKGEQLADKHAVLTCKDATGSLGGTRIEVYFKKKDAAAIEALEKDTKVSLRIKGSAFSTLIAVFDKRVK